MEAALADILTWLEPRALLLAVVVPPMIRLVGHWLPEELFMIAMGVLAARSGTVTAAVLLLGTVLASHMATDHTVYLAGRWLRPRLDRFPRIRRRLEFVTSRLSDSPAALVSLIPARVFPLWRGAWLAGCGVAAVSWRRFLLVDATALALHVLLWSGLGWWLADDLHRLSSTADAAKVLGVGLLAAAAIVIASWLAWRRRLAWQPATARAARLIGRRLRGLGRDG